MPNFLVRHRATERLIGRFAVQDFSELTRLVGRGHDLAACDYTMMGSAAGHEDAQFRPFPAGAGA